MIRRGARMATGIACWLLLSMVCGCGGSPPAPDASRQIGETFLKLIQDGKAQDAWQSTTAEFKSARGKEAFVRDVRGDKGLKSAMSFVSQQTVKVQDQDRIELLFRAADNSDVRLVLGPEQGVWKVDLWTRKR
jgi:hypothetical protein